MFCKKNSRKKNAMEKYVSVRNLVEFILRGGDIDNRRSSSPENAMQEGGRIHRMIQRQMGLSYHAEVSLKHSYEAGEYVIILEGRADGVILPAEPGNAEELVTIDEIKGTYRDLSRIKEPAAVHLAQAMCYAYMYAEQKGIERICVRMTYCNIETEELKFFYRTYSFPELQVWFEEVMGKYRKWTDYEFRWRKERLRSIRELEFPFPYRVGQKDLVTYVYQTIYHKRKLYIEAPTGVGKTISTVFPAVKAMGEGRGEKLFYLTAKTITRTAAEETFELLRKGGLSFKTVILTAKDKICFREETECNPVACPYAKGHYDRVNDAMFSLLTGTDNFTRGSIEKTAREFQVCPFELCLDMSLFADGVICDYNYVFDPHVYLKRFFSEGIKGDYLFLIDEAHNLVERGREMYSGVLRKEDFLNLKRTVKEYDGNLARLLEKCNKELLTLKRECEIQREEEFVTAVEGRKTEAFLGGFQRALARLSSAMDQYLEEQENSPVRKEILAFYFEVCHFQAISELLDENYVTYSQVEADGSFFVKLFCVNPSKNLQECLMRSRSAILFSATLLPIQYYKSLLGAVEGDYDVYARSVFRPDKKGLFIADDVTSKYTRRSDREYDKIARYIHEAVKSRQGNYMVFFPSHSFLRNVYERYRESFWREEEVECILQEEYMKEEAREEFLSRFSGTGAVGMEDLIHMEVEEENRSLVGFCVSGGIFSEGIDLKHDSLIGVVIVGTGLPQVCAEREIVKQYFDGRGENGFDYAYKLPGMNKVLQAAGRVIRTKEDIGIVVLLDERFLQLSYRRLFPREWEHYETVQVEQIAGRIEKFWNDWL